MKKNIMLVIAIFIMSISFKNSFADDFVQPTTKCDPCPDSEWIKFPENPDNWLVLHWLNIQGDNQITLYIDAWYKVCDGQLYVQITEFDAKGVENATESDLFARAFIEILNALDEEPNDIQSIPVPKPAGMQTLVTLVAGSCWKKVYKEVDPISMGRPYEIDPIMQRPDDIFTFPAINFQGDKTKRETTNSLYQYCDFYLRTCDKEICCSANYYVTWTEEETRKNVNDYPVESSDVEHIQFDNSNIPLVECYIENVDPVENSTCEAKCQEICDVDDSDLPPATPKINSINDVNTNNISVYPNPNNGIFNIDINNLNYGVYTLHISDLSGNIIHRESVSVNSENLSLELDLTELPSGKYTYTLESPTDKVSGTFVINK